MVRSTYNKFCEIFKQSEIAPKRNMHGGRKQIESDHYILIFIWLVI